MASPDVPYLVREANPTDLVPLDRDELTVGRGPTNDLRLDEPQVSRNHARLVRQGPRVILSDLGSRNGTFVNGRRLAGSVELRPGDRIDFAGAAVLVFHDDAAARAQPYAAEMSAPRPAQGPQESSPHAPPGGPVESPPGVGRGIAHPAPPAPYGSGSGAVSFPSGAPGAGPEPGARSTPPGAQGAPPSPSTPPGAQREPPFPSTPPQLGPTTPPRADPMISPRGEAMPPARMDPMPLPGAEPAASGGPQRPEAVPGPTAAPPQAALEGLGTPPVILADGDVTFGTAPYNTVVLVDRAVSPRHALVRNENGQFVLYDLSGAGRTYLNGHPLQSGRALEPGDEVGIGGSTFIFRRLQLSPQRPPPFRPQ